MCFDVFAFVCSCCLFCGGNDGCHLCFRFASICLWFGLSVCLLLSVFGLVCPSACFCVSLVWSVRLLASICLWFGLSVCLLLSVSGLVSPSACFCLSLFWSVRLLVRSSSRGLCASLTELLGPFFSLCWPTRSRLAVSPSCPVFLLSSME